MIKTQFTKVIPYLSLLLISLSPFGLVNAGNIGIGVTVRSDYKALSFPIDINSSLNVTPFVQQYKFEQDYIGDGYYEYTLSEIGTALYKTFSRQKNASLYAGFRLSYIYNKEEDLNSSKYNERGYRFSPTVGFRYKITEHLSVSGEAEWYFLRLKDKDLSISSGEEITGYSNTSATASRVIFAYHF